MGSTMKQDRDHAYAMFALKQDQAAGLLKHNSELIAENNRLTSILAVIVRDLGGEIIIPNSSFSMPLAIEMYSSGEGRDDELTITICSEPVC